MISENPGVMENGNMEKRDEKEISRKLQRIKTVQAPYTTPNLAPSRGPRTPLNPHNAKRNLKTA
jgi:hypothetical protein